MKFMQLNLATLILRFYLLMAVVIVAFFAGIPWLAILSLPILLSLLMGVRFERTTAAVKTRKVAEAKQHFTAEAHSH
jgi:hypothetical protein